MSENKRRGVVFTLDDMTAVLGQEAARRLGVRDGEMFRCEMTLQKIGEAYQATVFIELPHEDP